MQTYKLAHILKVAFRFFNLDSIWPSQAVVFSNGTQLFISMYHLDKGRAESDFHVTAIHFLATARAISKKLFSELPFSQKRAKLTYFNLF